MYVYKKSRSTCVSARDVPVMMGISPFQSRDELLLEKCDYRKQRPFTDSMKRGVELEPEALFELCKYLNIDINEVEHPGFTRHKVFEYIGGVPDGIYKDLLIEIKCPSRFTQSDKPADFYIAQMQVYMQIFNLQNGIYVEYIQNEGLKIIAVKRDDTWWKWVTPLIKSFWNEVNYWRNTDIKKYPKISLIENVNLITAT